MAGHCPGHHLRPLVTSAGKRTWQLQYGTRVIIDQDQPMTGPFFTCFSNGCVADYEATHHPGVARRALSRHVSSLAKATKEAKLRKKDCGGLHPRRYIGRERGGDATRRGDEEECPGRSPPPKPGLLGKTPMTGPQPSSARPLGYSMISNLRRRILTGGVAERPQGRPLAAGPLVVNRLRVSRWRPTRVMSLADASSSIGSHPPPLPSGAVTAD